MRGAAYTFRNYNDNKKEAREWAELFGIASLLTPILLGVNIGAISSGSIIVENNIIVHGFIHSWLSPFSIAVGVFALVLFAYLGAVSLILESRHSKDPAGRFQAQGNDFPGTTRNCCHCCLYNLRKRGTHSPF